MAGGDSVDLAREHDEALPFAQVFAPLADDAVARVNDDPAAAACFSPVAVDRLRFHLLERLAHIAAEPVLAIYGAERDQAYRRSIRDEISGALARLSTQYPVAVRLMTVVTDQWVDSVLELAGRVESDRELLAERLSWGGATPLVADVSRPLGDHHNGGRHVLRLTDDQNRLIVYKPRPMAQEAAYGRMLDWANRQSVSHRLLVPTVVDQGAYGWMENIAAEACVDADAHNRYSHRAGTHLSLLRMLGATDLHVENVIAAGEQPAMVDLECLLQPRLHDALRPQKGFAGDVLADSVLFTGLLPGALPERGVLVVDLSGLGGQASQVTGTQIPAWRGLGTDGIRLGRTIAQTPPSTNQPTPGAVVDVDALIAGYEEMDAILASGDAPLTQFEELTTRVVLRSTPRYAAFMRAALRPRALRCEAGFDAEIDVLNEWASELEDLTDDSSEVAWG